MEADKRVFSFESFWPQPKQFFMLFDQMFKSRCPVLVTLPRTENSGGNVLAELFLVEQISLVSDERLRMTKYVDFLMSPSGNET